MGSRISPLHDKLRRTTNLDSVLRASRQLEAPRGAPVPHPALPRWGLLGQSRVFPARSPPNPSIGHTARDTPEPHFIPGCNGGGRIPALGTPPLVQGSPGAQLSWAGLGGLGHQVTTGVSPVHAPPSLRRWPGSVLHSSHTRGTLGAQRGPGLRDGAREVGWEINTRPWRTAGRQQHCHLPLVASQRLRPSSSKGSKAARSGPVGRGRWSASTKLGR